MSQRPQQYGGGAQYGQQGQGTQGFGQQTGEFGQSPQQFGGGQQFGQGPGGQQPGQRGGQQQGMQGGQGMDVKLEEAISEEMRVALHDLVQSATACEWCAERCIDEGPQMAECIRLCRDVADLATLNVQFIARDSIFGPEAIEVFANAAEACAQECARHGHRHCQECAEVLSRAVQSTRKMLASFGQGSGQMQGGQMQGGQMQSGQLGGGQVGGGGMQQGGQGQWGGQFQGGQFQGGQIQQGEQFPQPQGGSFGQPQGQAFSESPGQQSQLPIEGGGFEAQQGQAYQQPQEGQYGGSQQYGGGQSYEGGSGTQGPPAGGQY